MGFAQPYGLQTGVDAHRAPNRTMHLSKFALTSTANDHDLRDFLHRRYGATQTHWGRGRLTVLVWRKRLLWNWRISGSLRLKRFIDIVGSAMAISVLSPLILLIALLVRTDGGPAVFTQTRVGKFGREFRMFKFRSMCLNAEARLKELLSVNSHAEGVTFKIENDPRITKVGKWLRKLSLDELPQFFNVLIGDMSLVGPRPPVPGEVARYTAMDRRRLAVNPGITCVWQISGRSEIDFSDQVRLDVCYIETQTFWQDVRILAKTVPAVISGRGAC
jgi:lipopolysaccharide/colanic/teichoic acid biosynthesis glycosyltransferase